MMQKSKWRSWILFYSFLTLGSAFSTVWALQLLQLGSRGEPVREVQSYLYELKYLSIAPTGYYGKVTEEAVKRFQAEHGLKVDGKIGPVTLQALKTAIQEKPKMIAHIVAPGETLADIAAKYRISPAELMAANSLSEEEVAVGQQLQIAVPRENAPVASRGRLGEIQAVPWEIVQRLWGRGEIVRIIDLRTGRAFQVRRHGGHYHSDAEPLTARDTQVMLSIYRGRWSWTRRPVVVQIRNQYIAASINGMPHGGQTIKDNNFNGHFCVHFLGSRLHKNGRVDPDHQEKIQMAAAFNLPLSELAERAEPLENRRPNAE